MTLWDVASGSARRTLREDVTLAAFSPDGTILAAATSKENGNKVLLLDLKSGARRAELKPPEEIEHMAFSGDGRYLATAGGKTLILWDPSTGRQASILAAPETVRAIAFPATASSLAIAADNEVAVYRISP